MALYQLLLRNPLLAFSVCLCLLAIAVAIRLVRRINHGSERFIAGFVGLVAAYEGFKILMQVGIWTPPNARGWVDLATLGVTGMFVFALIVVQELGSQGHRTRFLLRILEVFPNAGPRVEKQDEARSSVAAAAPKSPVAGPERAVITGVV